MIRKVKINGDWFEVGDNILIQDGYEIARIEVYGFEPINDPRNFFVMFYNNDGIVIGEYSSNNVFVIYDLEEDA